METKKQALVTGAGRGIGYATAERLCRDGYNLAFTYRNSEEGAFELQEKLRAMGSETKIYRADMSDLADINAAFDAFENDYGKIDLLVNNAGVTRQKPFLETTPELYNEVMDTDVRGYYFMAQRAAKLMIKNDNDGNIINIASNQGDATFDGYSVYGSAKAALIKLTRHLALELGKYNIRVNSVSPGFVDTGWSSKRMDDARYKIYRQKHEALIPLGSYALPDQVAGIVSFLSSDDAVYITGENIVADGGARLPVIMDVPLKYYPDEFARRKLSVLKKQRGEQSDDGMQ